ncbi:MAG: hypothetical protein A2651_01185 [Candidatus Yanofskybacteria bacterium RIFCSPHIGHO2_01_FULL_42_12]|uniref:Uncharacterized protein n=1 Tax=Candidatus Yanofskybacteria bacterium RIFCSPLOWO2_01_FULL_42_49 TaxID=1802694 RepID=A0A1F8GBI0_9BACT|nr:MAG: hypothetical protein A2651_01185 [Candidatus Yanofskybacteria bacterium RIFCSPHIGHO2_01_FULL_42_12]OGN22641.1 MAG: hypothetical protein A2918_00865 [Candidatus Yanofskybacteria bacterium RIFCSPLOWO2_01_FULL_42_49]
MIDLGIARKRDPTDLGLIREKLVLVFNTWDLEFEFMSKSFHHDFNSETGLLENAIGITAREKTIFFNFPARGTGRQFPNFIISKLKNFRTVS